MPKKAKKKTRRPRKPVLGPCSQLYRIYDQCNNLDSAANDIGNTNQKYFPLGKVDRTLEEGRSGRGHPGQRQRSGNNGRTLPSSLTRSHLPISKEGAKILQQMILGTRIKNTSPWGRWTGPWKRGGTEGDNFQLYNFQHYN